MTAARPAGRRRRSVPATLLALLGTAVAVVLLAACGSGGSAPSGSASSGSASSGSASSGSGSSGSTSGGTGAGGSPSPGTGTGAAGVAALAEGECVGAGTSTAFDWSAAAVDCQQPHTVEVFGVLDVAAQFPSASYASVTASDGVQRNAFLSLTQQACTLKLSQWAGGSVLVPSGASSTASIVPYFYGSVAAEPVPGASWDAGDKRVACYATFGAHGSDEGSLTVSGSFLKSFWAPPASDLDARFCQASVTVSSVSCAQPHDREYIGQFFAQQYPSRPGFDAKTLAAFDSATATQQQWLPYDQFCQQVFGALIAPDGRSDVAIVADTSTTAAYWGLGGSYAMQCVASPSVGYVRGSLLGIGAATLPTAPTPTPSTS